MGRVSDGEVRWWIALDGTGERVIGLWWRPAGVV